MDDETCTQFNIPKEASKYFYGTNELFLKISYKKGNNMIDNLNITPKKVELIMNNKRTNYLIYSLDYCKSLIENIGDLFIEKNNILIDINFLDSCFYKYEDFKIILVKLPDYLKYLNKITPVIEKISELKCNEINQNFKFYFKHHDPESKFIYNHSISRDRLIINLKNNKKIKVIYCPFGIGKSISLIFFSLYNNIPTLYLNLKALFKNQNNVIIWKYNILYLELVNVCKKLEIKINFTQLKQKLEIINNIWDSIFEICKYFKEEKLSLCIIFDQYQEKIDIENRNIKKIINLIGNINNIDIIICRSINDNDVKNILFNQDDLFEYKYYINLFDTNLLIENDLELNEFQKDVIKNDFNLLPIFYYQIKTIHEKNDLENFKQKLEEKIDKQIKEFYEKNNFSIDKFISLFQNSNKIGMDLEKNDFLKLIELLPIKYFVIDFEKYKVNYSFNLVKKTFEGFINEKIFSIFSCSNIPLRNRSIGDLIEMNFITDLKSNIFCKLIKFVMLILFGIYITSKD